MRTILRRLTAALSLVAATAAFAGCAAPTSESNESAQAADAVSRASLAKTKTVAVSEVGSDGARLLGAPGKIGKIVSALRLGAELPEGTTPRCMFPRSLELFDAEGASLGVARVGSGCGIFTAKGKTRLVEVDDEALGAVLAQNDAVGDLLAGVDAVTSFPDNESFDEPEMIDFLLGTFDLDELPAPLGSTACPAPALVGGYRFLRDGEARATIEPNFDCELEPGVVPATVKLGNGDVYGVIRMKMPVIE